MDDFKKLFPNLAQAKVLVLRQLSSIAMWSMDGAPLEPYDEENRKDLQEIERLFNQIEARTRPHLPELKQAHQEAGTLLKRFLNE